MTLLAQLNTAANMQLLIKTDITDVFKQIGIRRDQIVIRSDQHHLFCMKWKGLYYYYARLCFGSRSSPCIFDILSQAVCWIAQENYGICIILHLLDDFLTIQSPETCVFRTMPILTYLKEKDSRTYNHLGIFRYYP